MIEIKIFGPTVISGAGTRLVASDLGGSKPRQLLEMLALDLGTPIAKDLLASGSGTGGRRRGTSPPWRATCARCGAGSGWWGAAVARWPPRTTGTCWIPSTCGST